MDCTPSETACFQVLQVSLRAPASPLLSLFAMFDMIPGSRVSQALPLVLSTSMSLPLKFSARNICVPEVGFAYSMPLKAMKALL